MGMTRGPSRGGVLLTGTTHQQQRTMKDDKFKHRHQDIQQQLEQQVQTGGKQQQEMEQQLQRTQDEEEGKQQQERRHHDTAAIKAEKTGAAAPLVPNVMLSCSSSGSLRRCISPVESIRMSSCNNRSGQASSNSDTSSERTSTSTEDSTSSSSVSGSSSNIRKYGGNISISRRNERSIGSPTSDSSTSRRTTNSSSNKSGSPRIREKDDAASSRPNCIYMHLCDDNQEKNSSSSHICGEPTGEQSDTKRATSSRSSSPANSSDTYERGSSSNSSTQFSVESGSSRVHRLGRESSSSSRFAVRDSSMSHCTVRDSSSSFSRTSVGTNRTTFVEWEELLRGGAAGGRRATAVRPRVDGSVTVTEEAATGPTATLPPQPSDGWAARVPILRLRVDPTTGTVLLADELSPEQQEGSHGALPSSPGFSHSQSEQISSCGVSTGSSAEAPVSSEAAEDDSFVSSPGALAFSPLSRQSSSSDSRPQSVSRRLGSSRISFSVSSSRSGVEGTQRRRGEEEEERSAALLRYRLGSELAAAGAATAAVDSAGAAAAGSEAYAAGSRRAAAGRQRCRISRAVRANGTAATASRQLLSLGGESRRARVIEHETYTETQHEGGEPTTSAEEGGGGRNGFTWGEKVAHDGSWRERWMQQAVVEEAQQRGENQQQQQGDAAPAEPPVLAAPADRGNADRRRTRRRLFGQAQGINEARRERWTTRWEETEGQRRVVEKAVQELSEGGEVLQEWVEIIEENLVTGECSVSKRGEDYREGSEEYNARSWMHNTRRGIRRRERGTTFSSDAAAAESGTVADACAGNCGAAAAASAKGATETGAAVYASLQQAAGGAAGLRHRPVMASAEEGTEERRPVGTDVLQLQKEEEKRQWSAAAEAHRQEGEAYERQEEELIEETKGGVTRGQRRRRNLVSGREEHAVWYRKEATAADRRGTAARGEKEAAEQGDEFWQDTWIEDPQQGTKWGSKSGVNTRGEKWEEQWREGREGVREVRRWAEAADRQRQWGENVRFEPAAAAANDVEEEAHERWEQEHRDGTYVFFTDRWWLQPHHNNSWGEKKKVCYSAVGDAAHAENCCKSGSSTTSASTTHEEETQQEQGTAYEEVEEANEVWYDNGKEKVVDAWTTKLLLKKSEAKTASTEQNEAGLTASRSVLKEVKSGRKHTERYEDGMRWGETWHVTREPDTYSSASSSSSSICPPPNDLRFSASFVSHPTPSSSSCSAAPHRESCATSYAEPPGIEGQQQQVTEDKEQERRDVSQSSPHPFVSTQRQVLIQERRGAGEAVRYEARPAAVFVPPLHLTSRSSDVWWREAHGNAWGEKVYTDQQRGAEQREKWYDNGFERQVDRWHVEPDGSSHGEKVGSKADGTEWRERWGVGNPRAAGRNGGSSSDGGTTVEASAGREERSFWFDKSWRERRGAEDGGCGGWWEWGETAGNDGKKRWEQHWWKNAYNDGGGRQFVEKWEDDGHGNSRTLKTGSSWREEYHGQHTVTSWFEDSYGEVQQTQEKWAFKRGCNEEGDSWLEKWNNKPSENTAEKQGSNARGDNWREQWRETFDEKGEKTETWAEKVGRNAQGDSWYETWHERGCWWKTALKEGRSGSTGEHWVEKWGEDLQQNGAGEKWCQKYACSSNGSSHGTSWGNRWGAGGEGGHAWGEEWNNEHIHKWWHDTPGRPAGC